MARFFWDTVIVILGDPFLKNPLEYQQIHITQKNVSNSLTVLSGLSDPANCQSPASRGSGKRGKF